MKKAFVLLTILLITAPMSATADEYVNGYYRNGTYVAPHYQTSPNATVYDNYSTRGNVNPYTGQPGTINPYPQPQPGYMPAPPTPNTSNPYYNVPGSR